jgi:hypothetical protein
MYATLVEAFKEDPKEVIVSFIAVTSIFVMLWGGLWLAAILEGRV